MHNTLITGLIITGPPHRFPAVLSFEFRDGASEADFDANATFRDAF